MTSGTGRSNRAFSLFELLIVLGIIALFAGFFVLRFDDGQDEEQLTEFVSDVQLLASKGKKRAYAFRQDQYVLLTPTAVVLSETRVASDRIVEAIPVPETMRIEYRLSTDAPWEKGTEMVWTFRGSGLSEPVEIRATVGNSYATLRFNVLTALAEEEMVIQ